MDYKQIMLNLIEFNRLLQGWIDDFNCGEIYDENKTPEWNDGAYQSLEDIHNALEGYGLLFTDEDELDLDVLRNSDSYFKED